MLPKLFMRLVKSSYGTTDSTAKIAQRPLLGEEAGMMECGQALQRSPWLNTHLKILTTR